MPADGADEVDEFCVRYNVRRSYWDPRDWQSEIDAAALKHGEDRVIPWATYRITPMQGPGPGR